jgi:hypothetical protein
MGILKKLENIFAAAGVAEEGDVKTARMIMAEDETAATCRPECIGDDCQGLTPPPVRA